MTQLGKSNFALLAACLVLVGLVGGCSSDSPTRPSQEPTPPPGTTPPTANWNITVTADPSTIELLTFEDDSTLITVTVRNAADGSAPPTGTLIQVTTTLGSFDRLSSTVSSVVLALQGGVAQVNLYTDFGFFDTGSAIVEARLEDSRGSTTVRIIGGEGPYISHIEPDVGRPEGGYAVNIVGGGFVSPVTATLGGLPAPVLSSSESNIRIEVPGISLGAGETRTVAVSVSIGQGTPSPATVGLASAFTYAHGGSVFGPQIFSMSPTQGTNEGGYQAVIRGANFASPSQVLFGDSPEFVEATINSIRSNEIVVTVPPATGFGQVNQNKTVDLTVRSLNNGQEDVLADAFTYGTGSPGGMFISSMGPTQGPISGGQLVTIYGFGFEEPVAVGFGGLAQQVISVTGTEVVVRTVVPERTSCGDIELSPVSITNIETNEAAEADLTYTYLSPPPILLSVSPPSGDEDGGNTVTLTGTNFEDPARVTFGDSSAILTNVISSTTTTAVVPPFTGTFNTESCDDNGDGTAGERNLPTSVDVSWDNPLYTNCETTLTNAYTYNPDDTSCRNDQGVVTPVPPTANFTWSPAAPAGPPVTVTFQDLSSGGSPIVSRIWNFGDGSAPSSVQNPSHDFTAAGDFSVSLTVTDSTGATASIAQTVTVAP